MSAMTISQVMLLKEGADGERASVTTDGSREPGEKRWAAVHALKPPKREIEIGLILEDGTYVPLPFCELAWILPDRTGVLVIFKPGSYTHPDGSDVFPYPNNAAIYNADGSLRFQVRVMDPRVHHIECMHGGTLPKKFEGMVGVLVAFSENDMPAWAYAVNPLHPDLIDALQWVRY